jgi:hypothetical protein
MRASAAGFCNALPINVTMLTVFMSANQVTCTGTGHTTNDCTFTTAGQTTYNRTRTGAYSSALSLTAPMMMMPVICLRIKRGGGKHARHDTHNKKLFHDFRVLDLKPQSARHSRKRL